MAAPVFLFDEPLDRQPGSQCPAAGVREADAVVLLLEFLQRLAGDWIDSEDHVDQAQRLSAAAGFGGCAHSQMLTDLL